MLQRSLKTHFSPTWSFCMCSRKPQFLSVHHRYTAATSGLEEQMIYVKILVFLLTFVQPRGKKINVSESQFLTRKLEKIPSCTVIVRTKSILIAYYSPWMSTRHYANVCASILYLLPSFLQDNEWRVVIVPKNCGFRVPNRSYQEKLLIIRNKMNTFDFLIDYRRWDWRHILISNYRVA